MWPTFAKSCALTALLQNIYSQWKEVCGSTSTMCTNITAVKSYDLVPFLVLVLCHDLFLCLLLPADLLSDAGSGDCIEQAR